jgi:Tol biopolymer transport system component
VPTVRGMDGSDYLQQISPDGNVTFPAYSPDGRSVLYTYHPPGGGFSVKIVTLPGSPTTEATTLINRAQQPSWQPVG